MLDQRLLYNCAYFLLILNAVSAFKAAPHLWRKLGCGFSLPSSSSSSSLDGELNKFFEATARSGSSKFKHMRPEERMEYALRGEALENDIYDLRDRMNAMESAAIEGQHLDIEKLKLMREELAGLKQDYIDLVGGDDLPLYFGKSGYDDALQ